MYGIIYKIINKVNGKVYIGQTVQGFNKRYKYKANLDIDRVYKYHKSNKENGYTYNEHLLRAIKKYGLISFDVIKVFDFAFSKEELDIKEICWITVFDCFKKGYNNCEGGNGISGLKGELSYFSVPVVQLSLQGEYIKTWKCMTDAQLKLKIHSISSVCRNILKSAGGYMWLYTKDYESRKGTIKPYSDDRTFNAKSIVQTSLGGEFLCEYESLEEACKKYKIHKGDISKCLSYNDNTKNPKSASGYLWYHKNIYLKYKNDIIPYIKIKTPSIPIVRLDLLGNYIDEFNGITEAGNVLNINMSNISAICSGNRKATNNYRFMYKEDYDRLSYKIEPYIRTPSNIRPIVQMNINGEYINKYISGKEAQNITGINKSGICNCLKGKTLTSGGYKWVYLEDYI